MAAIDAAGLQVLPEDLRELVTVIGWRAAIALCRHLGGRTLHIPRQLSSLHPVSLHLRHEEVLRLVRHWGGQSLSIPSELPLLRLRRDRAMVRAFDRGETVVQISWRFGVSRRQVSRICGVRRGVQRRGSDDQSVA